MFHVLRAWNRRERAGGQVDTRANRSPGCVPGCNKDFWPVKRGLQVVIAGARETVYHEEEESMNLLSPQRSPCRNLLPLPPCLCAEWSRGNGVVIIGLQFVIFSSPRKISCDGGGGGRGAGNCKGTAVFYLRTLRQWELC